MAMEDMATSESTGFMIQILRMSILGRLLPKLGDDIDRLTSALESLPLDSSTVKDSDEGAFCEDESEPAFGLIDLIRRDSLCEASSEISSDTSCLEKTYSSSDQLAIDGDSPTSDMELTQALDSNNIDDDSCNNILKNRQKHVFILSENGKPVFTRYGDEDQLVTLMGVMQTLVSFAELTESSQLKYLKAGRGRIAFLHKEPFVFVIVTHTNEHISGLLQQLTYVYYQIISTLTLSRIKQKFSVQPSFDIRRWLSTAERKLLHNIIDMYECDLGLLMTSAKCLCLPLNIRNQIGQTVVQTVRGQKDLVFALVLAHGQLISIARLRNYHLHPSDLYLVINLVKSTDAFQGVESWVPVCLPRFDPSGCFHAHISYLDDECDICLVLLTVNPETFQILSDFKQTINEKFKKYNLTLSLKLALQKAHTISDEIAFDELRFFAYKSRVLSQYTSTPLRSPYNSNQEQVRLFELIRFVYGRLHYPSQHPKVIFHKSETESLLGWLASGFELHVVFSPLVNMETVISCADCILSYIRREETQLFLMRCEYL